MSGAYDYIAVQYGPAWAVVRKGARPIAENITEARARQMAARMNAAPQITPIRDEDLPPQFQAANFYVSPVSMVEAFKAYCRANGIFYYARPREDFSEHEGYELAAKAGARYILLEDLS
jgi:hypothetical protein